MYSFAKYYHRKFSKKGEKLFLYLWPKISTIIIILSTLKSILKINTRMWKLESIDKHDLHTYRQSFSKALTAINTSENPIAYLGSLTKLWTLNATVDNVLVLLVKHTRRFHAISFIISSCNFTNCPKSVAVYFISIHLNKCSNIRSQ